MEAFLLIFSITCIVLGLLLLLLNTGSVLKVKDLKISKKKFVLLVLQWCSANLGTNKNRYYLHIYYYRSKECSGRYLYWNHHIVIYLYDDLLLTDLVQTILHEHAHHLQFSNKNAEQDYNKSLKNLGYWNHPFEIQARKVAERHKDSCFEWVIREMEKSLKLKGG